MVYISTVATSSKKKFATCFNNYYQSSSFFILDKSLLISESLVEQLRSLLLLHREKVYNITAMLFYKKSHWNPSKLTHFNTRISKRIARYPCQNKTVEMCPFTRIPMTRFNVSFMLHTFSQCRSRSELTCSTRDSEINRDLSKIKKIVL